MASNLRVDSIVPSTGANVSIGTATGGVNIPGVLTYEDVTNVDSVGVITGRSNINCTSGRFQRGTTTVQDGDAIAGGININGTDMDASVIMSVFGNDGDFTRISGSKSRNASVGSHTIVQNNDVLLSLKGFGSDGTNFEEAAQIEMQVDGTPGNNVMPGRILFKTTATDGAVERLRIGSAGQIGLGGANYGTSGQVLTSQGASSAVQWATPAGGKILQVVNVYKGDRFTTNSTSWADITGLSIAITPSASSSKIMLICSMGAAGTRINNGDYGNGIRVMRDIGGGGYSNNNKFNGAADGSRDRITFKGHGWSYNNDHMPGGVGFTGVDDPSTTSQVTYKVQVQCQSSSYAFFLNGNTTNADNSSIAQARSQTSIIAMEIGG